MRYWPALIHHTRLPAYHWFSFGQLARELRAGRAGTLRRDAIDPQRTRDVDRDDAAERGERAPVQQRPRVAGQAGGRAGDFGFLFAHLRIGRGVGFVEIDQPADGADEMVLINGAGPHVVAMA